MKLIGLFLAFCALFWFILGAISLAMRWILDRRIVGNEWIRFPPMIAALVATAFTYLIWRSTSGDISFMGLFVGLLALVGPVVYYGTFFIAFGSFATVGPRAWRLTGAMGVFAALMLFFNAQLLGL